MKHSLRILVDKVWLWLSAHWLLVFNLFFIVYIALPLSAPFLLAFGYTSVALAIYRAYGFTCHQLPDHSYFIAGYQVAICQRCTAIHAMMAITGLLFVLLRTRRLPPLTFKWYLLFLIPVAVDGGMQLVSQLLVAIPAYGLWVVGLAVILLLTLLLYFQQALTWQAGLFFLAGPVSLLYVQWIGPYESDWLRRTITGVIYATGTIWLVYPMLEESFLELHQRTQIRLSQEGGES